MDEQQRKCCFNRTFMELKWISITPVLMNTSFNRTFMELK